MGCLAGILNLWILLTPFLGKITRPYLLVTFRITERVMDPLLKTLWPIANNREAAGTKVFFPRIPEEMYCPDPTMPILDLIGLLWEGTLSLLLLCMNVSCIYTEMHSCVHLGGKVRLDSLGIGVPVGKLTLSFLIRSQIDIHYYEPPLASSTLFFWFSPEEIQEHIKCIFWPPCIEMPKIYEQVWIFIKYIFLNSLLKGWIWSREASLVSSL